MPEDYSNLDYFWVPIHWDVADYLLKHYREDWEGITPNGINLDPWYQNLKEASEKQSDMDGGSLTVNYLDSPSTTSSTTYSVEIWNASGNQAYVNRNARTDLSYGWNGTSTITLIEV